MLVVKKPLSSTNADGRDWVSINRGEVIDVSRFTGEET